MAGRAEAQRFFNHQAQQTHFLPPRPSSPGLPSGLPHPILGLRTLLPSVCTSFGQSTLPPPRGPWGGGRAGREGGGGLSQQRFVPRQHLWTRSLSKSWRLLSQQLQSGCDWAEGGGGARPRVTCGSGGEGAPRGPHRREERQGQRVVGFGIAAGNCARQGRGLASSSSSGPWDRHPAAPQPQFPPG